MENLKSTLDQLIKDNATATGRKFDKIELTSYPIRGRKVGYAHKFAKSAAGISGKIAIDSRFIEWGDKSEANRAEVINTLQHELAHVIAESERTAKKQVWHGQAWKDLHEELGGDGSRYYAGEFVKPENEGKKFESMEELRKRKPTQPATDWERGTFRQWLTRGYHVVKGQKGSVQVWQFIGNEYETDKDGKTSRYGRAAAVYFTPDQVEANA